MKNTIKYKEDSHAKKELEVTPNNNATMKFVNKLLINGEQQKDEPKKVTTTVNGKNLILNCKYIVDDLVSDAYKNHFKVPAKDKDVQVFYAKSGTVLSACIYIDGKLEFSCMAMQTVFTIIEASFGIKKLITDKLYIMSNINRKKAPESKVETEVKEIMAL